MESISELITLLMEAQKLGLEGVLLPFNLATNDLLDSLFLNGFATTKDNFSDCYLIQVPSMKER